MNIVAHKTRWILSIALSVTFGSVTASLVCFSAQNQRASGTLYSPKAMADGNQWTTFNLNVKTVPSYCYENSEENCRQYGRLYTWESARRGCQSLGDGWRLPTNDEWQKLAKQHGGVRDDSDDGGKAAYQALVIGGDSGFNAVFGGGRSDDGQYARLQAHGFYWTASENGLHSAWLYNFGQARILNRHNDGEKLRALSVRCIKK